MKIKIKISIVLSVVLAVTAVYALAQQSEQMGEGGASRIVLEGGFLGSVEFPHGLHQSNLGDCDTCHSLYPQEEGAINRLEESGELRQQQVMNSQCIDCHRKNQAAGEPTGPVKCSACHNKG